MADEIYSEPTLAGGNTPGDDPDATLFPEQADTQLGQPSGGVSRASGNASTQVLQRGALLGRYVVLDRLGEGGMGVVYAGYDPELDRRVAIKLVKLKSSTDGLDSAGRSRLLREAQAMARLNHANVVAVYDVGTWEESMFVAMELVEGQTLSDWLASRRAAGDLSWRELLPLFVAAGRGLEAAHAVGIVHRDFKPENVMIADDGRVLVLDFGLARAGQGDAEPQPVRRAVTDAPEVLSASVPSMELPLTATGSLMGTPAFMSPEQFAGEVSGPPSDQFSFCVTLYEALYGERPFVGNSLPSLARAVLMGEHKEPSREHEVPSWLYRVVARGLAVKPEDRHESMTALLAELSRDRVRRRNRVLFVAGVVGLVGVSSWGAARVAAPPDPCAADEIEAAMAEVWGARQRGELQASFRQESKEFSEDALSRTQDALDRYAATWVEQRTEACEGAQDTGTAAGHRAVLQAACLDTGLQRASALVRVLSDADAAMVARAPKAVESLPEPSLCSDERHASSSALVPEDSAQQERVEALRLQLVELSAMLLARPDELVRRDVGALVDEAREVGFEPLLAEVLMLYGSSLTQAGQYDEAEPLLKEGLTLARVHGMEYVQRRCLQGLIFLMVHVRSNFELAQWLADDYAALAKRAGNPAGLRAWNLVDRARIARARDDWEQAIELLQQALRLFEQAEEQIDYLAVYDHLAVSLVSAERFDEAAATVELAQQYVVERRGSSHPLRGNLMVNQARIEAARGNADKSVALQLEALQLFIGAFGPEHPNTGAVRNGLGLQLEVLGRREEAVEQYQQALAVMKKTFAADHVQVAIIDQNLGNVLRRMGRAEQALPLHQEGLAIRTQRSPGSVDEYEAIDNLADDLRVLGRYDEAIALYDQAIAKRTQREETAPDDLAYPELGLALCWQAQGKTEQARQQLESIVAALADDEDADSVGHTTAEVLSNARLALAMLLRERGEQLDRVEPLLAEVRAYWKLDPAQYALHGGVLQRWEAGGPVQMPIY